MRKHLTAALILASLVSLSSRGFAYDCSSDCSGGGYSYPCPSWSDPGKMCHGDLPNDPTCLSAKEASCNLWNAAVGVFEQEVQPLLSGEFNHNSWQAAVDNGSTKDWTDECIVAGTAACAAVATKLAPPWSTLVGGVAGGFVSARICEQAHAW